MPAIQPPVLRDGDLTLRPPRSVVRLHDWATEALRLRTIEVLAHRDNAPSRTVARRSGFQDTGELRTLPRDEDPGPPRWSFTAGRRDRPYSG